MKKSAIITSLLSLLLFFQVSSRLNAQVFPYDNAVNYNDYIIDEQNKIGAAILDFTSVLSEEVLDEDRTRAKYKTLVDQISASVAVVESMNGYDGETYLRDASLALFRFYRDIVNVEYKEMMEIWLKEEITSEDNERMGEMLEDITAREAVLDEAFQEAQTRFAKKYNILLQENPLQGDLED